MNLQIVPISIKQANEYVAKWHRHNSPVRIARFALAVQGEDGNIHAVGIVGLPLARALMDGYIVEILRVASDGTRNTCSMLYGNCRKAAFALGFNRVITYNLHTESGASLKAAGFQLVCTTAGGKTWQNRPGRKHQQVVFSEKNRWESKK